MPKFFATFAVGLSLHAKHVLPVVADSSADVVSYLLAKYGVTKFALYNEEKWALWKELATQYDMPIENEFPVVDIRRCRV